MTLWRRFQLRRRQNPEKTDHREQEDGVV
jgi:hypothetical protein